MRLREYSMRDRAAPNRRAPESPEDLSQTMVQEARRIEHLLTPSLDQEDELVEGSPDNGELIAEALAYKLALKRIPRAEKIRRSFCFRGHHCVLFCELLVTCSTCCKRPVSRGKSVRTERGFLKSRNKRKDSEMDY